MPDSALTDYRPRRRQFEGLYNFRDLGGLDTDSGRQSTRGLVYRSDAFANLTEADAGVLLDELKVQRLIDLRADREVAAETPTRLDVPTVAVLRRPIDDGPGTAVESAPAGERLAHRYLDYLNYAAESILAVLRDLAEPGAPVTIIHCRAGKDRTGVVVATVLSLLGVSDQDIAEDYAVTSIGMPQIMSRLRESPVYRANVKSLPVEMYSAEAVTMLRFLGLVQDRHGSLTDWALRHGLTASELHSLKGSLITPA